VHTEIIYASADNKVYIFDPQSEDQTRDRQTILNDGTEADIPSAHFRADSIPELPVKVRQFDFKKTKNKFN
jgi:hypothetical protein